VMLCPVADMPQLDVTNRSRPPLGNPKKAKKTQEVIEINAGAPPEPTGHQGQGLTDFSSINPVGVEPGMYKSDKRAKVYQSLSVVVFSYLFSQISIASICSDPSSSPSASGLSGPTDPSPKISNH
jgi:hypothetical protein